ncbi:carbohydrate kinase family protein [Paracoccus aminophilus]|uniref:Fructokinase n=1 Tax=Paracoccus aminophilus JCM 7686 TaxID=1367847 RepID=S5Y8N0_PARAH|nr:carbohydrate kinase [Paracoccus aminophilus]AGT07693.1 fructokinase [Paracoccus aminophilus JCM 7686]
MILCAGESLIDMVPSPTGFTPLPGGAVYNTAIALGRMAEPTAYLWPISTDPFGEALLAPLHTAGVETRLCPRTDRPTTLAFVTLTGTEARYSFYDEGSAGRLFAQSDLPVLPASTAALFIGGISLVPEPCGTTIETLAECAHALGIPVMIDPNIRPFFITEIPSYRARLDRLIALADLVKLSQDDIDWLWPDTPPEELMTSLLAKGPKAIFRTLGAAGAEVWWAGGCLSLPAQPVEVADTIGAGDTFNAGVLAALRQSGALGRRGAAPGQIALNETNLRAALTLGIKAAALTVSRSGANPPWADELARGQP